MVLLSSTASSVVVKDASVTPRLSRHTKNRSHTKALANSAFVGLWKRPCFEGLVYRVTPASGPTFCTNSCSACPPPVRVTATATLRYVLLLGLLRKRQRRSV